MAENRHLSDDEAGLDVRLLDISLFRILRKKWIMNQDTKINNV